MLAPVAFYLGNLICQVIAALCLQVCACLSVYQLGPYPLLLRSLHSPTAGVCHTVSPS